MKQQETQTQSYCRSVLVAQEKRKLLDLPHTIN